MQAHIKTKENILCGVAKMRKRVVRTSKHKNIFSWERWGKHFYTVLYNTDARKCISYLMFSLDPEHCTKGVWYCIHRWNLITRGSVDLLINIVHQQFLTQKRIISYQHCINLLLTKQPYYEHLSFARIYAYFRPKISEPYGETSMFS